MKDHRLQAIFSSFSDADWKSYLKFSRGQFEMDSDFGRILKYAHKNRRKIEELALDPKALCIKLRPKAKNIVFANVISQLCKHLEDYLVWSEIQKDQMNKDTLLLQAYANRGMTAQFHKQKEKGARRREKEPIGLWKDYHAFVAEFLTYFRSMTRGLKEGKSVLENCAHYFDGFRTTQSNFLFLEFTNWKVIMGETFDNNFNRFIAGSNPLDYQLSLLIDLKNENKESVFLELKKIFFEGELTTEIRHLSLVHLTSYIQKQGSKGDLRNAKFLFELYKYGVENNILFPTRKIPFNRYLNILNAVLFSEEYEWADYFVNNFSIYVDRRKEKEVKALGLAQISFRREQFEQVIRLLREVKFKSKDFESRSRWFIICSFFCLNNNDIEQMEYYIQSFVLFLRRNSKDFSKNLLNSFVNSAYLLLKIAKGYNLNNLMEEVNNQPMLYYRKWLKQQLIKRAGHTI